VHSLVTLPDSDLKRTTDLALISHVTRPRSKENYRFCTTVMLVFIMHTTEVADVSKMTHYATFHSPTLRGSTVAPVSDIRDLILMIANSSR
jgi:hypothetical protein